MEARQSHPEDEDGEETALLLRRPPGHDLATEQQPTHFDEGHAGPRQQYAYIAAQGSSRIHAGNSHVEHQHNYYGPEATPEKPEKKIMSLKTALAFPEMSLRAANIATAQAQTCDWIFETPEYKRWLDPASRPAHHGILWIKGKPGAGKSTIMKHILRTSQKQGGNGKIISFFFNARGHGLERSTQGMYRALLYQIVDSVHSLEDMVDSDLRPVLKDRGWPLELLKDLFREAVLHYQCDGSLTCYVDALDECAEDEIREMLALFEDLGGSTTSKWSVCFTSRHYPQITVTHVEEMAIDNLRGHQDDISEYVQRRLKLTHVAIALKIELATEIRRKSSGVFLWVVLVVGLLNKTKDQGDVHLLRDRLQQIPISLHALFDEIIGNTLEANFMPIIQWSLYAKRPLKAAELYFAVMFSTGSLTATTFRRDRELVNERVLCDFITTSSKGFLETTTSVKGRWKSHSGHAFNWNRLPSDDGEDGPTVEISVQFIHESVREFFLEHGLRRLDTSLGNSAAETAEAVHQRLARWCLSYMELSVAQHLSVAGCLQAPFSGSVLNTSSLNSNPFLKYVLADGVCHHFRKDDGKRGIALWSDSTCFHSPRDGLIPACLRYKKDSWGEDFMRAQKIAELGTWLKKTFKYVLRYVLETPDGCHPANGQRDWDRAHVIRATIIGILSTASVPREPKHLCRHDSSTPRTTLMAGRLGNTRISHIHHIVEQLMAAAETEDELVVYVNTAAVLTRGEITDLPLERLCNLIQRMDSRGARNVHDALVVALVHHLPQGQNVSPKYRSMIETAQRHYQESGNSQLFRLLIGARHAPSPMNVGRELELKDESRVEREVQIFSKSFANDIIKQLELLELLARYLL